MPPLLNKLVVNFYSFANFMLCWLVKLLELCRVECKLFASVKVWRIQWLFDENLVMDYFWRSYNSSPLYLLPSGWKCYTGSLWYYVMVAVMNLNMRNMLHEGNIYLHVTWIISAFERSIHIVVRVFLMTTDSHPVSLCFISEGRGKKKKKQLGQMLATAALTAAIILGPIVIKSIALIAGKALLISKIAIVIAGTIALKKLATQPAHHETETVSHHYGRSLDASSLMQQPQDLAYAGQQTQPFTQS